MPNFLDLYENQIKSKAHRISKDYNMRSSQISTKLEAAFKKFWVPYTLPNISPANFSVIAIDSSSRHIITGNGGIFYVVRALALSKSKKYREVVTDFDFTSDNIYRATNIIHRKMEWLEHKVAMNAIKDGFDGYVLLDGSLYGRFSHIPLETGFLNDREFMLKYFEDLINLILTCKDKKIPIIGISKESRTSFFRGFLIKVIAEEYKDEIGLEWKKIEEILRLALDDKRKAIEEAEKSGSQLLKELVEELVARKPDFQLILNLAKDSGYTFPLMLGASVRWRRSYKTIIRNPEEFVEANFPLSSRDKEFLSWAVDIVKRIPELPSVISFHILPALNDTPMRVDVPAWVFGIEKKLIDIEWPTPADVNLMDILSIIASGYCGLDNYNIWLVSADKEVKLSRKDFEDLYLPIFERIVGKSATPRGYRRVRFP